MNEDGQVKLQVSAVTEAVALAALAGEWRELAVGCPAATIFQTQEWNAVWWRHFGNRPGFRLRVLTLRDEAGTLMGLAPLMTSFWYGTPLRRLSFLGVGASDYLDILARPGAEAAVAEALYAYLQQAGGWQIADFQQLREDSALRTHFPSAGGRLSVLDVAQEPCPYLALPTDWDTLLRGLGKKTRANIGYYDRALSKIYEVEFGAVADAESLDEEMVRLFELHQRRWNERWLPGVFGGKRVQAFHRDVARALLGQGRLRLFYLKLDGQTQASLYCFAYRDRMYYYQGGFEPTLAKLSLGTVLTARAMQTAIAEKRAVFDFLRGDEPYKAKWTNAAQVNGRRLLTRSHTGYVPLARMAQRLESGIEHRAKAWMRHKK